MAMNFAKIGAGGVALIDEESQPNGRIEQSLMRS